MPQKPEESLIGKTFEKCRILGKLGTGGMGSVYLAEHFGLGRKVAVKILPPDMSRDPEYVARFMREATTAGRMEHPNIVHIHDVGYAEGRHFIVMQYVDGESLSTVVEELGAMDPRDAARVAVGILRGLQHAHEQGIVHRDVKPDNVLLTKGDEPKILDFGLAIEQETALQITRDGMVVGTPYYLSPEQARGHKATPRSDVYAAGVTLYYLLTGKRPFVGATALAVLNKHIHEAPVPPVAANPKVPRALSDIVLKMMAKRPEDRYPGAGAAADDLERFLAGKEVHARVPFRLPPLTRTAKIAVAGGAAAAVLLVVLIAVLASGGGDPAAGPPPPAPPAHAVPTESPELMEALAFDADHRKDFAAWEKILNRYDAFLRATTNPKFLEEARKARDEFVLYAERRADQEYAKLRADPDPVVRKAALESFPRPLLELTKAGERVRAELAGIPALLEKKYAEDESRLTALLESGDFREARRVLEGMLAYASAARSATLRALREDLPRRETEFKDPLVQRYAPVRQAFSEALLKRRTAAAYKAVTDFLRGITEKAERDRAYAAGVNYSELLRFLPEPQIDIDYLGQVRDRLAEVVQAGEDRLAYEILSDLLDALDVEWLFRRVDLGLAGLRRSGREVALVTFGGAGKVDLGPGGITFKLRGSAEKPVVLSDLRPADLVLIAAAGLGEVPEEVLERHGLLARAAGVAWLHSREPDRLAQAVRWMGRAARLKTGPSPHRVEKLRATAVRQARDRLARAEAEVAQKKFESARRALSELEAEWAHDEAFRAEVGRVVASAVVGQLRQAAEQRDFPRVKQSARELRAHHAGRYDEVELLRAYGQALRSTGYWEFVGTDLRGGAFVWEGKAQGTAAPAKDEGAEGLRMAPGKTIALAPERSVGATGASVQVRVADAKKPVEAGLGFEGKDARYRWVLSDASRASLYATEGGAEKLVRAVPLASPAAAGEWVELAFVAEGGDLVGYVRQQPVAVVSTAVTPGRPVIQLVSDTEANLRRVQVRK
jgi:tRNA A-37 threonylcarbamoyl transferase component Bud32